MKLRVRCLLANRFIVLCFVCIFSIIAFFISVYGFDGQTIFTLVCPMVIFGFFVLATADFGEHSTRTYRMAIRRLQRSQGILDQKILKDYSLPCDRAGIRLAIKDFQKQKIFKTVS